MDQSVVVLHPSRLKSLALAGICAALFVGGAWMIADGQGFMGWFVSGVFGLGLVIAGINLLPGASSLTLDHTGMHVRTLFRQRDYVWSEIACFGVGNAGPNRLVFFDFVEGHPKRRPLGSELLNTMDAALPDSYGRSPEQLALLLEKWRTGQGDGHTSQGQISGAPPGMPAAVSGGFGILVVKLASLFSFLGGPLLLADQLGGKQLSPWAFALCFAPVGLMVFGALAIKAADRTRFDLWSIRAGMLGALVLLAMNALAMFRAWSGTTELGGLASFGIAVGSLAAIAYCKLAKTCLNNQSPAR